MKEGQKSEIWVKDMKIYEMISSESNQKAQPSANNSGEKRKYDSRGKLTVKLGRPCDRSLIKMKNPD